MTWELLKGQVSIQEKPDLRLQLFPPNGAENTLNSPSSDGCQNRWSVANQGSSPMPWDAGIFMGSCRIGMQPSWDWTCYTDSRPNRVKQAFLINYIIRINVSDQTGTVWSKASGIQNHSLYRIFQGLTASALKQIFLKNIQDLSNLSLWS